MKEVIIIGAGKSVQEGINKDLWEKIKNKEIWSLNWCYKFMPYMPKRELWVDTSFFSEAMKDLEYMSNNGVEMFAKAHGKYDYIRDIKQFETVRSTQEFDKEPHKMFVGQMGLTGIFALSVAVKEGYDTIYLLGYDFGTSSVSDKETHFYLEEARKQNVKSSGLERPTVYLELNNTPKNNVTDFNFFNRYNKSKIYNVSLISHISAFDKISYDTFFSLIGQQ